MSTDGEAPDEDEIEGQLQGIMDRAGAAMEACHFATSVRLYGEAARTAKANGKLIQFIEGRFHEMDKAQYSLKFDLMRECAIELIAVLEDEEHARRIEPNFPGQHYEGTAAWMTTCLYENLAEAIGNAVGFNSEGMHECIADGLQVCHTTGKLACISCFREYATDVYTSADDSMMAMHQCYTIMQRQGGWSDRGDRRWYAAIKLAKLQCLEGKLTTALETYKQALEFCGAEDVSLELECKLRVAAEFDGALILAGRDPLKWSENPDLDEFQLPPGGEWPSLEILREWNAAVADCCNKEYESAISRLTNLDRPLSDQASHWWFENRLRLIAAMKLDGQSDRAQRLADQLKKKAKENGDHLTIRRLGLLDDSNYLVNPIVTLEPLDCGPFAGKSPEAETTAAANETQLDQDNNGSDDEAEAPEPSEMQTRAMKILQRFATAQDESQQDEILTEYLAIPIEGVSSNEAMGLLHFSGLLAGDCQRGAEIWEWAQQIRKAFPDEPSVMSMVAKLGDTLRNGPNEALQQIIDAAEIEKTFRLTLSMDADRSGNHLRAGEFFLSQANYGEAERCLARAFRLKRDDGRIATLLSDVYANTDRMRDSLAVLDACLREGCEDPNVAWQAAMNATHIGQHASVLTYLDKFAKEAPDEPWTNYYRALAYLQLGQFDDAVVAADAEATHEYDATLHLDLIRTTAYLGSNQRDPALAGLANFAERGFGEITELTATGIAKLTHLLYDQVQQLPENQRERVDFVNLLLESNMMPDAFFDSLADDDDDENDSPHVFFFLCVVRQPLDSSWSSSRACLAHEKQWDYYLAEWGVVAEDIEKAEALALEWQARCGVKVAAEFLDASEGDGPYIDTEQIVFQGRRWTKGEENT
jgi:tetratricopeptide (TPR) repeat protein